MTIPWKLVGVDSTYEAAKVRHERTISQSGFTIHTYWWESNIDVINNTSTIHMNVNVVANAGTSYQVSSRDARIYYYFTWQDDNQYKTVQETRRKLKQNSTDGEDDFTVNRNTITFTVKHKAEGALNGRVGINWYVENLNGYSNSRVPKNFQAQTQWDASEGMPRFSEITDFSMDNEKGEYSCAFSKKNSEYVEQVSIKLSTGATIKTVRPYLQNQVIKLDTSDWDKIYRETANVDKGKCDIILSLETYTKGYATFVSEDKKKQAFEITDTPTISSVEVLEDGALKNYIGTNNFKDYVRFLSHKRINIVAEGKKYASIKSIKVTYGTITRTYSANTVSDMYENISSKNTTLPFNVTVVDSRNNETTMQSSINYLLYDYPVIQNLSVIRDGDTDDATMRSGGLYWNGTINNVQNRITLTVVGGGNSTGLVSNHDGIKWNDTRSIIGADPNQSFTYKVTATDSFGQSVTRNVTLPVMKPIMQFGKSQVDVNGNFAAYDYYLKTDSGTYTKLDSKFEKIKDEMTTQVNQQLGQLTELKKKNGDLYAFLRDYIYPVGSIIYNENESYDPNREIGGTWSKVIGRFIVGAGAGFGNRTLGGATEHTHGTPYGKNGSLTALIGHTNDAKGITMAVSAGVDVNQYQIKPVTAQYTTVSKSSAGKLAYATAVHGETEKGGNLPPYYAVTIWRRTA